MRGFFSPNIANQLTAQSNFYIDWSRVGNLLRQGTHRYSLKELTQRAFILTSSVGGAYLGYCWASNESTLNSGLFSMAACAVSFFVSHLIVISPLIYKRYQMSKMCENNLCDLLKSLNSLNTLLPNNLVVAELIDLIPRRLQQLMDKNLSNEHRANASATWGKRRLTLENLSAQFKFDVDQLLVIEDTADQSLIQTHYLTNIREFWLQDIAILEAHQVSFHKSEDIAHQSSVSL